MDKLLLIFTLLFFGCIPQKSTEIPKNQINVNLTVYVRSEHDAKERLPKILKVTKEKIPRWMKIKNIKLKYYSKNYPNIVVGEIDNDRLRKLTNNNFSSINVFFVHKITIWKSAVARGLYSSKLGNVCSGIIVLSDMANETTLVHEIGHFFGLNHETDIKNIMSHARNEDVASFNNEQKNKMLEGAKKYLRLCS